MTLSSQKPKYDMRIWDEYPSERIVAYREAIYHGVYNECDGNCLTCEDEKCPIKGNPIGIMNIL